ncbi:uncharacterized protein KY384_003185 [Bacidia gigantensis]|uniref:uncharacterized protein n=1 Tax=Bacidia gigantensis TaxID=2732470 RepID=UPI001D0482D8|nr:uncharacterized protein KY384_003185 [Bacidia gigantensis]KAG8531555.1 hypothetical protein KY384_003185 [Bacidia gigantensis]
MRSMTLSVAAATNLPPSSPSGPPLQPQNATMDGAPTASSREPKHPLRRAPSSSSMNAPEHNHNSPLARKTSRSSLQEQARTPPPSPSVRRSSSYITSSPRPSLNKRPSLPPPAEEVSKPPLTAADVALGFFKRDLELNHNEFEKKGKSKVIVVLQDDCYGHRYARPRTSKASLNTIVERPERIHASILGLATAYVRLGGRHVGGYAAPHPQRPSHSFSTVPFKFHKTSRKVSLRSPAAVAIHGLQWMNELSAMCDKAEANLLLNRKELLRPTEPNDTNGGLEDKRPTLHEGDLYLCSGSLKALEGALGGVCEAVDAVFSNEDSTRAFVCIRPPGHHCSADMPSGFCWLNNVHVGISHGSMTHGLTHAAIIDFDLHHGDGSQSITWAHNSKVVSMPKSTPMSKKTSIGYFSLHDINSYPCEMGDDEKVRNASLCIENAHGQSIWNVHLQPWKTEADFWALYEDKYLVVLAKARSFLRIHSNRLRQSSAFPKPKAAIFLSAGFDASEWESQYMQRHNVNVPTSFYARFTRDIVSMSEETDLGVDGRIISVLEGGYSDRALMSGVLSHMSTLGSSTSASHPASDGQSPSAKVEGTLESPKTVGVTKHEPSLAIDPTGSIDTNWWSLPCLEEIEALQRPQAALALPKKQRASVKPTYTSATESYKAKIVEPSLGRRSLSGSTAGMYTPGPRPPSPPPPDVGWATAALELSRLLVPVDRDTSSCKPEELNAEATRARRDRQSGVSLPSEAIPIDSSRMQLREKRPKQQANTAEMSKKLPSRTSRRKTVADMKLLTSETTSSSPISESTGEERPRRPTRRRSSVASTVTSLSTDLGSDFNLTSVPEDQKARQTRPPTSDSEAVKPSSSKRPHVGLTLPTGGSSLPEALDLDHTVPTKQAVANSLPYVNEDTKAEELNQLTSGMKKMSIKLNVPSKEEYVARQVKAKPGPKSRPTKASAVVSKTAVPSKSNPKSLSPGKPKRRGIKVASTPNSKLDAANASIDAHKIANIEVDGESMPGVTQGAPPGKTSQDEPLLQPQATSNLNPIRDCLEPKYDPNEEAKFAIESSFPLPTQDPSFMPPVAEPQPRTPPTVRRTKADLPIFSPTSPIVFSSKDRAIMIPSVRANGMDPRAATVEPLAPVSTNRQIDAGPKPIIKDRYDHIPQPEMDNASTSIWDVPDTPQSRST